MWAMPFIAGTDVGAVAVAFAGGVCAAANTERLAVKAIMPRRRSAVRAGAIFLCVMKLSDMERFLSAPAWSDFIQLEDSR
jgi:hypothetical protein